MNVAGSQSKGVPRLHPRTLAVTAAVLAVAILIAAVVFAAVSNGSSAADASLPPDAAGFASLDLQGRTDTDGDGLADATENYVTGTDPGNWSTNGDPIPDGWLARVGQDPLRPGAAYLPATSPPSSAVPAAWGPNGIQQLTPSLWDVYSYGRPSDWDEETMGGWNSKLDPNNWDQNNDGIPDGFLLLHGLSPLANIADEKPANGLSVREAYKHATNPTVLDTDGDGLTDQAEIKGGVYDGITVPPSDPLRFDSSGTGACDGYLAYHGIDPNDGALARSDPDKDGASTVQEAIWSFQKLGSFACSTRAGLDPNDATSGDARVPDGWLLRYGLDPLKAGVDTIVTQKASTDPGPALAGADLILTVRDEYNANKPPEWKESVSGPWPHGTDPTKLDTDGDGLGDAWELRGYSITVTTDVGSADSITQKVRPNPTRQDTDGDGVPDGAEANASPPTDATRRDTDLDGLSDQFETAHPRLNPLRADSAGDLLSDGQRYLLLEANAKKYSTNSNYDCIAGPGTCLHKTVNDWLAKTPGGLLQLPLTPAKVAALLGPDGDVDNDGDPNIIDRDMDNDGIDNGAEVDPSLYARTSYGLGPLGARSATDPLNLDSDGDGLRDGWEVQYGVPAGSVYDLDPSLWDSDKNEISDGKEDPDKDSITWFSYRLTGGSAIADPHTFAHDNLSEQTYETHPRKRYSDDDGLRDGWKVFWSQVYPGTVGVNPTLRGDVYPGSPGAFLINPARPAPVVGLAQADTVLSTVATHRTIVLDSTTDDRMLPHEQKGTVYGNIDDGKGGTRNLVVLTGIREFTFSDAQDAVANPYVDDTDGDGMPDAWERAHNLVFGDQECTGSNGPKVAVYDADVDGDGDDLSHGEEYAQWILPPDQRSHPHPLCADSDHDTFSDGEELELGLDLDDPTSGLVDDGTDQDQDGITDLQERRTRGTHPLRVDTDGDGLADGANLGPYPKTSNEAKRLLELGIAMEVQGDNILFFGEQSFNADPLNADPTGTGVPQGWLVVRCQCLTNPPANTRDVYTIGMPAWWDHSIHGPWWGGGVTTAEKNNPTAARNSIDLDEDGLLDRLGEDLYPAVNRANVPLAITPAVHPTLVDWDSEVDPTDGTAPALNRRLAAQSLLNPRVFVETKGIGRDPAPSTQTSPPSQIRATPTLSVDDPGELTKGASFVVSGTLQAAGKIAGVTVVAEIAGQPLGAGFTDSTGAFSFTAKLAADHSVVVPAGSVFKGKSGKAVDWTTDSSALQPGDRKLRVYTYATPNTTPFTADRAPLHRTEQSLPVTVKTPTTVTIETPAEVLAGERFVIQVTTTDASGDPLREPVRIQTPRGTENLAPDINGQVEYAVQSANTDAGSFIIHATTVPTTTLVTSGTADALTRILLPVTINLQALPTSVQAGQTINVGGSVTHALGGASGVPVKLQVAGVVTQVLTNSDGSYNSPLTISKNQAPGTIVVQASAEKTGTTQAKSTSRSTTVLALPRLLDTSPTLMPLGAPVLIKGTLLDAEGAPIANAAIKFTLGDQAGTLTTNTLGAFEKKVAWSPQPGPSQQTLRFAGSSQYGAVEQSKERFMVSDTFLTVEPGTVLRGTTLELKAVLKDAADRPVVGVPIIVGHEGNNVTVVTGAGGLARADLDTTQWSLGEHNLTVGFLGTGDGSLRPTKATSLWTVSSKLKLIVPEGPFLAGTTPTAPRLVDAATGTGVMRDLLLTHPDQSKQSATTRTDGSFDLYGTLPADAEPAEFVWKVHSDGDDNYPAFDQDVPLRIVSATTLTLKISNDAVAGKPLQLQISAIDGRGVPGTGEVRVFLDGVLYERTTLKDGKLILAPVTPDAAQATLKVEFDGSAQQSAATAERTLEVLRPTVIKLDVQEGKNGLARITVTATRDGQPLPYRDLHVSLEDLPGGIDILTDEHGKASFSYQRTQERVAVAVRLDAQSGEERSLATTVLGTPTAPGPDVWSNLAPYVWTLPVLLVLAALSITAALLWRRRSPLEQELRETLRTVRGQGPVEEVILHAYYVLQRAALRRQWITEEAPTPRALQETLIKEIPRVPQPPLGALIGLFETARYGNRTLGEQHRQLAIRAIETIRRATAWGGRA